MPRICVTAMLCAATSVNDGQDSSHEARAGRTNDRVVFRVVHFCGRVRGASVRVDFVGFGARVSDVLLSGGPTARHCSRGVSSCGGFAAKWSALRHRW